ncbi:MAG: ATP-dependent helicase [Acidobacteriota bacterium]
MDKDKVKPPALVLNPRFPSSSLDFLLQDLNDEQRLAVTRTDGPLLILAGAGSGKTRTITYKIAYLIGQGICRPENVLAVTFTNKAAEEMRGRVERLLESLESPPLVSTFHSFSVRVLRRYAGLVGYGSDFSICDEDDQKALLKQVYEELKLQDNLVPIKRTRAIISRAKNQGCSPESYLEDSTDPDAPIICSAFKVYQRRLKEANGMDFDDLILLTVQLLSEHPKVREGYASTFKYLLIDEYQDTNLPQFELVKHLASIHHNISAVGDEDQSIYRFRGADINNILRFERDFPGAVVVKLEQNYRSTQTILDAATGLVSHNVQRKGKKLWTAGGKGELIDVFPAESPEAEAEFVSRLIYQFQRESKDRVAVLYRTNFLSRQLEDALRRLQIPYRLLGGVSFYSRREVKDALAYLRAVRNPDDDIALGRIINEPPRGIGKTTLDRLWEKARQKHQSLWRTIKQSLASQELPGRAHLALEKFSSLIEACAAVLKSPLDQALRGVLQASGYIAALEKEGTEEAKERLLNLQELVTVASEHVRQGLGITDLLDNAALYSDTDEYDQNAAVLLMTLHNAKGLEFPIVFIIGCEEGLLPHSLSGEGDDLEEERRLCYVGLTRAQKKIYLTFSKRKRFSRGEVFEKGKPSRFLAELPQHLLRDLSAPTFQSARLSSGAWPSRTYNTPDSVRRFLAQKKGAPGGFVKGALVEHHDFGRGRVLDVQESGDDLKITVQFPDIGIKKLLQKYAKLKLV